MGGPWTLREYKLAYDCGAGPCTLQMIPVPVAGSPSVELFQAPGRDLRIADFQQSFLAQIPSLSESLGAISMEIEEQFYSAENISSGGVHDLSRAFARSPAPFQAAVEAAIPAERSLSGADIMARANALTCAGCHQTSNNRDLGAGERWPASLGFVHVSERRDQQEQGPEGARFGISPALRELFLPQRLTALEERISGDTGGTCGESEGAEELTLEVLPATPLREQPAPGERPQRPMSREEVIELIGPRRRTH